MLVGSIATVVLIAAWSVASPVGSVPDSSFHLSSIWCANASPVADCRIVETIPGKPRAYLPAELIYPPCFSVLPDGTTGCTAGRVAVGAVPAAPNQLTNLNPDGFYSALGFLAGQPVEGRVVLMRLVIGCLSASFIGCSAILLRHEERRRFLLLSLLVHLPLGLFLTASVNASGAVLAVTIATVPVGVRLHRASGSVETAALLAGSVLLLIAAANLRKEAPILVLTVLLALAGQRLVRSVTRSRRTAVLGLSFVTASAIAFLQVSDALGLIRNGLNGILRADGAGTLTIELVLTNAIGVFLLWFAGFGGWSPADVAGLGSMDVVPPWPTALLTGGVLVLLLREAQRSSRSVPLATSVSLLGLAWVLPFWTLTVSGLRVGEQLQPRYVLPILAAGVIAASLCQPSPRDGRSWRHTYITASLSLAHLLALGGVVLHYSYGPGPVIALLSTEPSWRWTATHPLIALAAGAIAFTVLVWNLSSETARQAVRRYPSADDVTERGGNELSVVVNHENS